MTSPITPLTITSRDNFFLLTLEMERLSDLFLHSWDGLYMLCLLMPTLKCWAVPACVTNKLALGQIPGTIISLLDSPHSASIAESALSDFRQHHPPHRRVPAGIASVWPFSQHRGFEVGPAAFAIEYDTNRRLVVVFDEIAVVGCDSVAVR